MPWDVESAAILEGITSLYMFAEIGRQQVMIRRCGSELLRPGIEFCHGCKSLRIQFDDAGALVSLGRLPANMNTTIVEIDCSHHRFADFPTAHAGIRRQYFGVVSDKPAVVAS